MPPFEDSYFEFSDRPVKLRGCDCPGCSQPGDFRAPKSRDQLDQYYWFCLDHVRDYNSQWDYFAGLPPEAVEDHIRKATVWERPTWPLGGGARAQEQRIRDAVMNEFFGDTADVKPPTQPMPKAERDALQILELNPPCSFAEIKTQYRLLVKRHHPDANGGSAESEEKFKDVNQAFAVLKRIYATDEA